MFKELDQLKSDKTKKSPSRRKFLQDAALATGGLAGILASGIAPATAQTRELKMLVNSHFVPASDEELKRQLAEFGKAAGVKTRLDRVAHLQLPAVLAGEVQGQKGHDLVAVGNSNRHLYSKHLENLDDLYDKIVNAGGGWTTQFSLFSRYPGQTAAGMIRFTGQDGQLLELSVAPAAPPPSP